MYVGNVQNKTQSIFYRRRCFTLCRPYVISVYWDECNLDALQDIKKALE